MSCANVKEQLTRGIQMTMTVLKWCSVWHFCSDDDDIYILQEKYMRNIEVSQSLTSHLQ